MLSRLAFSVMGATPSTVISSPFMASFRFAMVKSAAGSPFVWPLTSRQFPAIAANSFFTASSWPRAAP